MQIILNSMWVDQKSFHFSDEKAKTEDFASVFSRSYSMQKNYFDLEKTLEIPFGDSIVAGNFTIHDIGILEDGFMDAFKLGMHNRWNSRLKEAFDPALSPSFFEDLITQENLKRIQSTLYAVYKAFGELGLEKVRGFNLAQAICDSSHYIALEDSEDKYDLDGGYVDGKKMLFLDANSFDPITRTLDALDCDDLVLYPNENIKSALFAMPFLLYRDGNMISKHEIRMLLQEIESAMKEPIKQELDRESFYEALEIVRRLFMKYNGDFIPKKESSKQYKIEEPKDK